MNRERVMQEKKKPFMILEMNPQLRKPNLCNATEGRAGQASGRKSGSGRVECGDRAGEVENCQQGSEFAYDGQEIVTRVRH
jgi:hypothetical protein